MQAPQRFRLRFAIAQLSQIDLDAVIPVFHEWIRESRLKPMMIDVADYKHVPESPGIIMVGHTDDFGIDNGVPGEGGGQGFHYTRKHARLAEERPFADRLREIWGLALETAHLLEQEAALRIRIDPACLHLAVLDRLRYPFTAEALAGVRGELETFFAEAYGTDAVSLAHDVPDIRYPMTWQVKVQGDFAVDLLLARYQAQAGVAG